MSPSPKIAVVANPFASRGKVRKHWPEIASALQARFPGLATQFTEESGHAISLTRDLLRQGYDLVIAAGGDGTINEVANGFVNEDGSIYSNAAMGILPLGTGGDFERTLRIPPRLEDAIEVLAKGRWRGARKTPGAAGAASWHFFGRPLRWSPVIAAGRSRSNSTARPCPILSESPTSPSATAVSTAVECSLAPPPS